MGCGLSKKKTPLGPFNRMEIDLLELMYNDLARRSRIGTLQKDTFLTFFHLNGLWGEQIFHSFDLNKNAALEFDQFKKGIETLVKGTYENKIHFLFNFYDIEKKQGISYDCLLKMLYSYPKEELRQIIDDEKFLGNMKDHEKQYYIGKRAELNLLREVVDEESSTDHDVQVRQRKYSDVYAFSEDASLPPFNKGVSDMTDLRKDLRPWASKKPIENKKASSMSFANVKQACKVKMCSNITLLVKKYATFLFKELNLDKDKDLLTESQFSQLIKKHQRIFMFYYDSFHNYIWEVDSNIPQFIKNTSWIEGGCSMIAMSDNSSHTRYLRFFKTTIFVFRFHNDNMPIDIINMEGLYIEEVNSQEGFGFIIKHRDGIYPENTYLFKTKAIQEEWLRNLSIFMKNSIYDAYILVEKIGAGNYSVVYRGVQRKTGETVAIKVIEKFKFSMNEKQVIRQECSILQLCHHPNIVTLFDKFQSKTTIYLVTEYMSDGDLHDYVKKKKFLEEYQAARIMFDILQAISYLNESGIIHRDLKSENIMLRLDKEKQIVERSKIIDFGFALYMDKLKDLPEKEKYAGTPNFVAPEILQGQEFDEKIDMFSIGVIMFFMLTGELPFDSLFADDIARQTIACQPHYDQSHWCNISPYGKSMISKLLVQKSQRLSVDQALHHPWIKQREDLKSFKNKNKKSKYV